jgi:hypothetical protein
VNDRELGVGTGGAWVAALAAWDARLDLAQARRAAEAFEAIAEREGGADAWAWCARACFYLADYGPAAEQSALLERGGSRGRKGATADERHVGAAFWTACCLAAHAETVNVLRRALAVPDIVRFLLRVQDLQPRYFHRGLARFLGQAILRQPLLVEKALALARPDFSLDVVLGDLRASVDEDPPFALTLGTLGELAWQTRKDRKTLDEMRARLDRFDPDAVPNLAPENHQDVPRFQRRLAALGAK